MQPIIVAAIPISDKMDASELLILLEKVSLGLLNAGIKVISYACDGTETERKVQRGFTAKAESYIDYTIPSPREGTLPYKISIPVFRGQPIVMIQDSKHALKTLRNNLFSGARLLHFGNYAAFFKQVHDVAFEDGSPLYHRDVEKLDRQDDLAASRLFSAPTLQYLTDRHPEAAGLIIYLFVFGELCDAYQNRHIGHSERIQLVLRARSYLETWERYLSQLPDATKQLYFISREAADICEFLVHGLISLILVHRDYVSGTFPLLPWLHSSEACEHIFGLARQIVKDFTMLDFIYMIPKLEVQLREAFFNLHRHHESDMKAQAAGYYHSYINTHNIDLLSLARFPSPSAITNAARAANDEVDSLITLLGIIPDSLHGVDDIAPHLPPVDTWAPDFDDNFDDDEHDAENETEILNRTISETESPSVTTERLEVLTNAAIAVTLDEQIQMYVHILCSILILTMYRHSLPDMDDETLEENLALQERHLQEVWECLADVQVDDSLSLPSNYGTEVEYHELSFESLVLLREKHQTYHAAHSVRTQQRGIDLKEGREESEKEKTSIRKEILTVYHESLRLQGQKRGITTGQGRETRWTQSSSSIPTGNTLNASIVSEKVANEVSISYIIATVA